MQISKSPIISGYVWNATNHKIRKEAHYMIIIMFCVYIAIYSPELTEALSRYDETGMADQEKLISSLANSSSGRGGNLKYSFNYLLLDPRVTKNLPSRMNSLG